MHIYNHIIVISLYFLFCRRKQYVGQVHFAYFDQSGQTGRRVIVGTDHNVIASLNARTGQIGKISNML